MLAVLVVSNHTRLSSWTGVCAGLLVWMYILFEAPLSGMSMNPARTFASAVPAQVWTGLWLYFIAPLLAMVAAGKFYVLSIGHVDFAKLYHDNDRRCIFCGR